MPKEKTTHIRVYVKDKRYLERYMARVGIRTTAKGFRRILWRRLRR